MTRRRPLVAAFSLATALVSALAPSLALACWDGIAVSSDKVLIAIEDTDATWTPERARHWAKWIARIDAVVPDGKHLSVHHGFVQLCEKGSNACEEIEGTWDGDSAFTMFERTIDLFGTPRAEIAAARRLATEPLTIQVAASRDRAAAEKLAARIDAAELDVSGFIDVGGFPSWNAVAHVVESTSGETVTYQVIVGAFLDAEEAKSALGTLRRELAVVGFVRPLDDVAIDPDEGC